MRTQKCIKISNYSTTCAATEERFLSRLVLYVVRFIVTDHLINKQKPVQTSSNRAHIHSAAKTLTNGYVKTFVFQRGTSVSMIHSTLKSFLYSNSEISGIMIKFSIIDTDEFASYTISVNRELQGAKNLLVVYSFIIHLKNVAICQ